MLKKLIKKCLEKLGEKVYCGNCVKYCVENCVQHFGRQYCLTTGWTNCAYELVGTNGWKRWVEKVSWKISEKVTTNCVKNSVDHLGGKIVWKVCLVEQPLAVPVGKS